ncbi:MAG: nucleotidyltransferase domain-containing protein [Nitrospirae bacterium]|nr:nucleotidyltransferase domain-containing protein [Nitrospirota bacterium]
MDMEKAIIKVVLAEYPDAQAVYLFGSYGTEDEWTDSDVDIAVLLPPVEAKAAGSLVMGELHNALGRLLKKDVDLINLRRVPTVLQKEVVMADRRIYTGDEYAAEEFEMLTISFYLKLNEERAEIVAAALSGGRLYDCD